MNKDEETKLKDVIEKTAAKSAQVVLSTIGDLNGITVLLRAAQLIAINIPKQEREDIITMFLDSAAALQEYWRKNK